MIKKSFFVCFVLVAVFSNQDVCADVTTEPNILQDIWNVIFNTSNVVGETLEKGAYKVGTVWNKDLPAEIAEAKEELSKVLKEIKPDILEILKVLHLDPKVLGLSDTQNSTTPAPGNTTSQ